jgi:RimJ/RimL family protein N-acetyltransferase
MVILRDVVESDLPIFFEHQRDELSIQMTGFPARDREAFDAHWKKILANENGIIKTIEYDGLVAGQILCFEMEGEKEVGYWLGREFWGKGIATEALKQFLKIITVRPLFAHTAKQNIGSRKVLEKCGFVITGEDKWTPPTSTEEVEEFALRLG